MSAAHPTDVKNHLDPRWRNQPAIPQSQPKPTRIKLYATFSLMEHLAAIRQCHIKRMPCRNRPVHQQQMRE